MAAARKRVQASSGGTIKEKVAVGRLTAPSAARQQKIINSRLGRRRG